MLSELVTNGNWTRNIPAAKLLEFAAAGQCDMLKMELRTGCLPNVRNEADETALMLGARGGHTPCVEALLEARADVTDVDAEGNTALHLACSAASETTALLLIEAGANGHARNNNGNMPFDGLCRSQPAGSSTFESTFEFLMARGRQEMGNRLATYASSGDLPRCDEERGDPTFGSMTIYQGRAWNERSHRFFPHPFRQMTKMLLLHSGRGPAVEALGTGVMPSSVLPSIVWVQVFRFMNRDWIIDLPERCR